MQNQEYAQLFSDAEYGNTFRRSLAIPILSTRIKQRDSSGEIMDKEKYRHSWPVSFCLCLEQESNRRHRDFQSLALPTELSRHPYLIELIKASNPVLSSGDRI